MDSKVTLTHHERNDAGWERGEGRRKRKKRREGGREGREGKGEKTHLHR